MQFAVLCTGAEVLQLDENNALVPMAVPVRMPDGQVVQMTQAQISQGLPDGMERFTGGTPVNVLFLFYILLFIPNPFYFVKSF